MAGRRRGGGGGERGAAAGAGLAPLGVPGQTAMARILYYHSPREDIEPPPGGLPIKSFKLLTPDDWPAFQATHTQYVREWDKLIGLR